ncbi:MAG: JAB domain-containing protein [Chloroflexi bacterium]|nr:MAG: JAB domain-containing protein [Chloroflexota bacterium]
MPTLEKTAGKLALVKLEYHPTIHDMPTDERPRERLKHYGPKALSTAELLAIILRTGTSRDNVIELAGKLLAKYGGLSGLMRADFGELCSEHGLGEAKASQLKAALEIGRRLGMMQNEEKYQIKSPADAANLVMPEMMYLDHEQVRILILDTKNQVVENINRYQGTVNSSVLRSAEIFRPAIIRNCPAVIVCHNHPSGDPTPSPEDVAVTEQLVKAAEFLDIDLVDHIVIGSHRFVSLKERLRW